jgi:uncharacterized Zn finger protein
VTGPVLHPRIAARRGGRTTTWWGRAWTRAIEEAAYGDAELKAGRSLARAGRVGAITVGPGSMVAAVEDRDDLWSVSVRLPVLDEESTTALVETVAAESGRVGALLSGDLPHALVEHAEEAGVELLPYGGELEAACTCAGWLDPCAHALALATQVGWLLEDDPFVLIALRGLGRDDLLARLHGLAAPDDPDRDASTAGDDEAEAELDLAVDAAVRAARILELAGDPEARIEPLL